MMLSVHNFVLRPHSGDRLIHLEYAVSILYALQKHGAIVPPRHLLIMLWDVKE